MPDRLPGGPAAAPSVAAADSISRPWIGTGSNPNVAAVVVIGIEEQWTQRIVEGIAATGLAAICPALRTLPAPCSPIACQPRVEIRATSGSSPNFAAHHGGAAGYAHELPEVRGCVAEGLTESPTMPLDDTVAVMSVLEQALHALGVHFDEGAVPI